MVGKNVEIYLSQLAKNALNLSPMVGEKFETYLSLMAKNAHKLSPWLEKNLKFIGSNWLKMPLN